MKVVGKVGSLISQGVYSVVTPFHPFGGAVDIIAVQQKDGSFRSTPWYVRFGKFQGVLKGAEEIVKINVNGVEANFHMYLDNSGEAYFVREADSGQDSETNGLIKDGRDGTHEDSDVTSVNNDNAGQGFSENLRLHSTMSDPGAVIEEYSSLIPNRLERVTNIPTIEQIASLNLKDGQNMVTFSFSTWVLGLQQVDAHIYSWKWNAKIVISDVDGTITKSDVLGQFMPLVGKDWTQSGVARLFSAIKENGYQLLFLSARAIVQAYLTRSFLLNLKQDGKMLPNGPVVISPDGLFPSLFREVIRRAPHEFKIACLEDIKALFPPDYNPFYAGFGNRDTDERSYRTIGIRKIFIINPKGEVAINNRIDGKSYTSLHTLVNDMFQPTSLVEQEDYSSFNFWKTRVMEVDG